MIKDILDHGFYITWNMLLTILPSRNQLMIEAMLNEYLKIIALGATPRKVDNKVEAASDVWKTI